MHLSNEFIAAVIGAIIGGLFTIFGAYLSFQHQRKIVEDDEKKLTTKFLKTLRLEISSVWNRYNEVAGIRIETLEINIGFDSHFPIFDNYFVFYDSNTNFIGNLDDKLGQEIVQTYIAAKGLKDSILFNNHLLNKITYYLDRANDLRTDHYINQHKNYLLMHQNYGKDIKELHFLFKTKLSSLLSLIDQELNDSRKVS